jgi:hypothetical protein
MLLTCWYSVFTDWPSCGQQEARLVLSECSVEFEASVSSFGRSSLLIGAASSHCYPPAVLRCDKDIKVCTWQLLIEQVPEEKVKNYVIVTVEWQ